MPVMILPTNSASDEIARVFSGISFWLGAPLMVILITVGIIDSSMRPGIFFFAPTLAFLLWKVLPDWLRAKPPGKYANYAYVLTAVINLCFLSSAMSLLVMNATSLALGFATAGALLLPVRFYYGLKSRAEQKQLKVFKARRTPYSKGGGKKQARAKSK